MGDLIILMMIAFVIITFALGVLHDMVKNKFLFYAATITGYSLLAIGLIAGLIDKLIGQHNQAGTHAYQHIGTQTGSPVFQTSFQTHETT